METVEDLQRIRTFIVGHIPKANQQDVADDDQLLENGLIDSLGILDVVTFLEEEFGITIDDEELTPENFQSIKTMEAYVQRKKLQNVHD